MSLPASSTPWLGICLPTCILFDPCPERLPQQFLVPSGGWPAAGRGRTAGEEEGRGVLLLEGVWSFSSDDQAGAGAAESAAPSGITSVAVPGAALLRDQGHDHSAAWERMHARTHTRGQGVSALPTGKLRCEG